MSTLRDDLLPIFDLGRSIIDDFGLRRTRVIIKRRRWVQGTPGKGRFQDTDLELTPRPRVRQLSTEEIAGSGGTYESGDLRIDRITPAYTSDTSGGYTPAQLKLATANASEEVLILLRDDEGTHEAILVKEEFQRAFGYSLVVRLTRRTP